MSGDVIWPIQLLRQQLGNCRRDVALSQRDHTDGVDDVRRITFFVQITARALPNQIDGIVLFRIPAEDQDTDIGRLGANHC